jgi:hypothetical protein
MKGLFSEIRAFCYGKITIKKSVLLILARRIIVLDISKAYTFMISASLTTSSSSTFDKAVSRFCTSSSASLQTMFLLFYFFISVLASLRFYTYFSVLGFYFCLFRKGLSSVNGGTLIIIRSPLFIGLKPILATIIAFQLLATCFFQKAVK